MNNRRERDGEEKILEFLLDYPTKGVSQAEIVRVLKLPASTVSVVLERLVDKFKWIISDRVGNTYQYKLDLVNPVARQYKKLRVVKQLWLAIEELQLVSRRVILFGSAGEGKSIEGSDIDVFVESGDKELVKKIMNKFENLPVRWIVKNTRETVQLQQEDPVFYDEVFNRGEVLWERE